MATKVGEAYYELTAKNKKLKAKLRESDQATVAWTKRMSGVVGQFGKMAFVGAVAGVTALTGVMIKATKAAAAEELQTAQLAHQIGRLGLDAEKAMAQVDALANSQQSLTRFGDTDTRRMLAQLIMLSNDYAGSMKNLTLAQDMAESGLFSAESATRMIGMAMTGNIEILGRYIPQLKSSNNEMLKTMTSSEKGAYAIELLTEKFGGLATQIGDTTAGAWAKLTNAISDAWEALGKGALKETSANLDNLTESIKDSEDELETVGGVIAKLGAGFVWLGKHTVRGADLIGQKIGDIREASRKAIDDFDKWVAREGRGIQMSEEARERVLEMARRHRKEREKILSEQAKAAEEAADKEIGAAKRALREKRKIWVEEQTEYLRTREEMANWLDRFLKKQKEERDLQRKVANAREEAKNAGERMIEKLDGVLEKSQRESIQKLMGETLRKLPELKLKMPDFKLEKIDIELPKALQKPAQAEAQPQWMRARELWSRNITARGKTEDEKHTSQFDSMIGLLEDLVVVADAQPEGLAP